MKLKNGDYELVFENGGITIEKDGKVLYFNRRPMYLFVKTAMAVTEFFDKAYDEIRENGDDRVFAGGIFKTPNGSKLSFEDALNYVLVL